MLNNGNKACDFQDEIVSYIYDEIDTAGRRRFETHLASCGSCTDEFAAVSDARFSVFEWQKEEFAHLATPEIVIPYHAKRAEVSTDTPTGFLSGFAELFTFARSPLAIGGALAVVLGLSLIAFNLIGGDGDLVATNSKVPAVAIPVKTASALIKQEKVVQPEADVAGVKSDKEFNEIEPVRAASQEKPAPKRQRSAPRRSVKDSDEPSPGVQARKPMLSDFREEEDKTLRLSDMFDEIGG
ncbi:MAG: zf-HC2 domain-containing protein [Pyrinomonadaceae bacterium]